MNVLNPYFSPVTACTAIILALVACLAVLILFLSLRKKIGRLQDELTANSTLPEKLTGIAGAVEQLCSRLTQIEERKSPLADWFPESTSVNLNRRGQVLRLHRRGESSFQIASALGLSQGEVKLIVKVHELTRQNPETEKTEERALISRRLFDTDTRGH